MHASKTVMADVIQHSFSVIMFNWMFCRLGIWPLWSGHPGSLALVRPGKQPLIQVSDSAFFRMGRVMEIHADIATGVQ